MPIERPATLLLLLTSILTAQAVTVMPLPAHVETSPGFLRIDASFRIRLEGYQEPRLRRAAERLIRRLEAKTGAALSRDPDFRLERAALTVTCGGTGKAVQSLGEDENYQLTITPEGARLSASQPLGVLRGLETFAQLVQPGPAGFAAPVVKIQDEPRFVWRGLSYDVSRHFMPLDQVRRTIDGMAAVKFNVFHWHLSDNQGFRVESRLYPRLQTNGSEGQFYTQAEVRGIVEYARDRGIRVVPEFDIPGHATAILVAYPALAAGPAPREIDHLFGVFDPVLDPTKPGVYVFLDKFIAEMAALFPDAYFHIGGDEVSGRVWREDLSIQAFKNSHGMLATLKDPDGNAALHALFNQRLQAILKKHGKRMEGWDEILSPDLPKDIVIQSWRGQRSLADAARLGYQGLLSSGYYLDLCQPAADHYAVDPLDKEAAALTPEEQKRILGGEAAMWSEFVTPETMDSRIWPRAAAIAERLWSPKDVRDVPDMYDRLELVSRELDWLGLTHRTWQSKMLERIAGKADVRALQLLCETLEPVKGYERETFGPSTTGSPLISLVDSTPPESERARRFRELVDSALSAPSTWMPVKVQLEAWRVGQGRLLNSSAGNSSLRDTERLINSAIGLESLGLEAIAALESGETKSLEWRRDALARVQDCRRPAAALIVVIAEPVEKLIIAASK